MPEQSTSAIVGGVTPVKLPTVTVTATTVAPIQPNSGVVPASAVSLSQEKLQVIQQALPVQQAQIAASAAVADARTIASATTTAKPPAAWSGWQTDLLDAINAPATSSNKTIVNAWHAAVDSGGSYNPLAARHAETGATAYNSQGVKNYPTVKAGIAGFKAEAENGNYDGILTDLRKGTADPVKFGNDNRAELVKWGVATATYFIQVGYSTGGIPTGSGAAPTPTVTGGLSTAWSNLLNVYDKKVPATHTKVAKVSAAYLDIFKR